MTESEKAKAYDEALKKAKNVQETSDSNVLVDWMEYIFPELAESKDEKIRKALIEMVHDTTGDELWIDYDVHKEDALAWLEKQGINYSLVEEIKKRKDSFMREKEKAVSSNDKLSLGARIAMLEELLVFVKEKQGKQKPTSDTRYEAKGGNSLSVNAFDYKYATITQKDFAPKQELKFHKGDWITIKE